MVDADVSESNPKDKLDEAQITESFEIEKNG